MRSPIAVMAYLIKYTELNSFDQAKEFLQSKKEDIYLDEDFVKQL